MDKKDKDIHVCIVCGGTHHDDDIFRMYRLENKKVCELCLQTTVAPASPVMYLNFISADDIVYEDKEKEVKYIDSLEEDFYALNYEFDEAGFAMTKPKKETKVTRKKSKSKIEVF